MPQAKLNRDSHEAARNLRRTRHSGVALVAGDLLHRTRIALALYAVSFGAKLWKFASHIFTLDEAESILDMLGLIDAALVASLVVMVIISGYENFVSKFDEEDSVHWLGEIDANSLKIKVASTIVAISSIHLLQIFLNVEKYGNDKLMWYTIIHIAFVVSALFLAFIDRVSAMTKALNKSKAPPAPKS